MQFISLSHSRTSRMHDGTLVMVVAVSFLTIALYCYFLPFEFGAVDGSFPPQDIKLIQYCEIPFYCFANKSNKYKLRMEKHQQRPPAGVRSSKKVVRDLKSPLHVAGSESESKSRRRNLNIKVQFWAGRCHLLLPDQSALSFVSALNKKNICSRSLTHSLPDKTENQILLRQD